MYMNNFNGSNLALSHPLFARSNSGLDIFNLYRSNSNQNILPMDPQSTASEFQNTALATSGTGMHKSSSLDQLANIVFMNEQQQQQVTGIPRPSSMEHLANLASAARSSATPGTLISSSPVRAPISFRNVYGVRGLPNMEINSMQAIMADVNAYQQQLS